MLLTAARGRLGEPLTVPNLGRPTSSWRGMPPTYREGGPGQAVQSGRGRSMSLPMELLHYKSMANGYMGHTRGVANSTTRNWEAPGPSCRRKASHGVGRLRRDIDNGALLVVRHQTRVQEDLKEDWKQAAKTLPHPNERYPIVARKCPASPACVRRQGCPHPVECGADVPAGDRQSRPHR